MPAASVLVQSSPAVGAASHVLSASLHGSGIGLPRVARRSAYRRTINKAARKLPQFHLLVSSHHLLRMVFSVLVMAVRTKYRISSMAWSFSLMGRSSVADSSQRYNENSRMMSVQLSQMCRYCICSKLDVSRMPFNTLLSACQTRNSPCRRMHSMKDAADGSTMTARTLPATSPASCSNAA